MRLPLLAAALTLLAGNPPALAQEDQPLGGDARLDEVFDRGCGDDDGNDRCDPQVQRRMRELYGLADARTLAEQGVTFRRVMFVDGYGTDVVAITFSRAPARSPMVEIATFQPENGPRPQPLSAVIDQVTWQRVLAGSEFFDRRVEGEYRNGRPDPAAPSADAGGEDEGTSIVLCLHPWFAVVEAADAARLQQNVAARITERPRIRRDSESGCTNGLAMPYGLSLAETALDNLPECSSLDLGAERNEATLLALCHRLGGDRLAAGEAMVLVRKLQGHNDNLPQGREFGWLFADGATGPVEPLRAALTSGNAGLYFEAPHASDIDHATVRGEVLFWGEDGAPDELADIALTLVRQLGEFRIQSYELGERKPRP